ncbi:MAG: GTP-binding protein, partial [Mycobacteriaceae bacterium]
EAIDVLLDGVVTARGRVWLATQPDEALWIESAGGGLRVASAGRWLAAMADSEKQEQSPERLASAALRWDDDCGDRDTSMVVLVHDARPQSIIQELHNALVTDEELAQQWQWQFWVDPFGHWHEDPCADLPLSDQPSNRKNTESESRNES